MLYSACRNEEISSNAAEPRFCRSYMKNAEETEDAAQAVADMSRENVKSRLFRARKKNAAKP
jgi:hypothetical protein